MNEKTKELAKDDLVTSEYTEFGWQECRKYEFDEQELERFAELIRDDERDKCAKDYLEDCNSAIDAAVDKERQACAEQYLGMMRDAVEKAVLRERENCAKLCEDNERANLYGVKECAAAIRARTI